jgi:hypothetical protein
MREAIAMNSIRNTLIDLLPREEGRQLELLGRPVDLQAGEVLQDRHAPTRHVYFPTGALVCLFATLRQHPDVEVAMVGHEGMVGIEVALGSHGAPLMAVVQEGGTALRVDAEDLVAHLEVSVATQDAMHRYIHTKL